MKNLKLLLLSTIFAMFLCITSYGAYLNNVPQKITQPNGKLINCFASGDERFVYMHDSNGYTIIKNPNTGYYVYANLINNKLEPTNLIVGMFNPTSIALKPRLKPTATKEAVQDAIMSSISTNSKGGAQATQNVARSMGKVNPLIIFYKFDDVNLPAEVGYPVTKYWQPRFNGENKYPTSIKSFFEEASYGKFTLDFRFPQAMTSTDYFVVQNHIMADDFDENGKQITFRNEYNWYLPLAPGEHGYADPQASIAANNAEGYARFDHMIRSAIAQLNDMPYTAPSVPGVVIDTTFQIPSRAELDVNNDGYIDEIIIIISGTPYGNYPDGYSNILWNKSATISDGPAINGVQAYNYSVIFADTLIKPSDRKEDDPFYTAINGSLVTHEILHNMGNNSHGVGVPDYAMVIGGDTLTLTSPWDIMGANTQSNYLTDRTPAISAYTKWKYLGWIDDIPVIQRDPNNPNAKTYYVNPITAQDNQAYRVYAPNSPLGEYFVLEYRDLKGVYEKDLPNEGLLIYRVKEPTYAFGQIIPAIPYELYAFRPGGDLSTDGSFEDAPFGIAPNRNLFDIDTNPASIVAATENGIPIFSGIKIKNIGKFSYGDPLTEMMAFDLEFQVFVDTLKFASDTVTLVEGLNYDFSSDEFLDIQPKDADIRQFKWESSNPAAATIDKDGYVRAIKVGTTTITVTSQDKNNNPLKATCTVNVIPQIPATEIILTPDNLEGIYIADEILLEATILPGNTTYPDVTWETSDSKVAIIKNPTEKSATIVAVSEGECQIIVKNIFTSKTAVCPVKVIKPSTTDLILTPKDPTIEVGESINIFAQIIPDNVMDKSIRWSSSNTDIVSVNPSGIITGVDEGTATITATTADNFSSTITVTVVFAETTKIEISPATKTAKAQETFYVTAKLLPANTSPAVTWSSSNEEIATVDASGKVTPLKSGNVDIIATAKSGLSAACKLTVLYADTMSITIEPQTLELAKGATDSLAATVKPSNADQTIIWKSFNPTIASVDEYGNVTAIEVGTTSITASTILGDKSATCQVTVKSPYPIPVTGVTLTPTSVVLNNGDSYKLTATISPSNASNKDLVWESLNTGICTVDSSGKITATGVGGTLVKVTTVDGNKEALCMVTVRNGSVAGR